MNIAQRLHLIHRAWRYRLRAEYREIAFVRSVVDRGDCVMDIGAHKAAFTYWMAKSVGDPGCVFAFEPNPELAGYLRQVADVFPQGRVCVVETALSDRQGQATLHFPGEHLGSASLELTRDVLCMPISVPIIPLDHYVASIDLHRPVALIKCDVEYHELAVLRGAAEILRRDRPILLVESGDFVNEPFRLAPVQEYLISLGYTGFFFHPSGLVPIGDFEAGIHCPVDDDHQNYVFVHGASSAANLPAFLKWLAPPSSPVGPRGLAGRGRRL